MLEINKCKLVPGITANWGEITGDITNQTDLVDYISTHGGGGGVAAWGSISGNISDQTDLMSMFGEYATQSFVTSALSGYATESWVSSQGYLTEVPSGYATESWVSSQGYLVESDLSQYATRQWVTGRGYITSSDLSGYATESWVDEKTVQYDKTIEIGDSDIEDSVDVLKREVDEDGLTKQLVLGYKVIDDGVYETIVLNDGQGSGELKLGRQEMSVEVDSGTGERTIVKGEFHPYYEIEDGLPVTSEVNVMTDLAGDLEYIPFDQDGCARILVGLNTDENTWTGLMVNYEGQAGLYTCSIETDAETQEEVLVDDFFPYLTEENLKTVNGESIVGSGDIEIGGLTPEQEEAIAPLEDPKGGMLYTFEIGPRTILRKRTDKLYANQYLYKLGDEVYLIKDYDVDLFDGTNFNNICHLQNWNNAPFWMDDSGRVYNGDSYQSDLETGNCTSVNLCPSGGYSTNGSAVHNIWHGDDGIYLMWEFYDATLDKNIIYKFNEDTQLFDIPCVENNTSGMGLYDMMMWYGGLKDYEGHHICIVGNTMYEVSDGEDSITCTIVTEYFPVTLPNGDYVNIQYFHNVGGEYYYLKHSKSSGQNYKLVEGQWVEMSYDSDTWFDFQDTSVDTDKLIFGGYNTNSWIPIVNPRNETYMTTSWQSVKSFAVDLDSDQSIKGRKTFENIDVIGQINCNRFDSDRIKILGNDIVIGIDQRNSTLNLSGVSIMNGDYIQAKGDGFFNVTKDEFGPLSRSMTQYTGCPLSDDYNYIWTTPSGRVFTSNGSQCYEMMDTEQTGSGDWSNWKAMTMTVYPLYCISRILTGGSDLYYVKYDDSKIYKWDEANSDWVSYIDFAGSDYYSMAYVNGTIMCYGNGHIYRYDTNDNMFVQAYDDPDGYWTTGKILELNGSVYQVREYDLFEVEFQNGVVTYTLVSNINWNNKERSFVLGGYIFICGDRVRKLDLSKVGTYEFETQLNYVPEGESYRGPWTDGTDSSMMVCDSGNFWLMYDLNYSKPEVPATNGTYTLQATRTGDEVTYEWVSTGV